MSPYKNLPSNTWLGSSVPVDAANLPITSLPNTPTEPTEILETENCHDLSQSTEESATTHGEIISHPLLSSEPSAYTSTLSLARAFLCESAVRNEPSARKAVFLGTKGFSEKEISNVLGLSDDWSNVAISQSKGTHLANIYGFLDTPSIVTYPEFLARPPRTPPLVTPSRFMAILHSGVTAATLIFSTARLVVAPMVDTLTNARGQLHRSTADGLEKVVQALEEAVCEDYGAGHFKGKEVAEIRLMDALDSYTASDGLITAVFSRDIGVQTDEPQAAKSIEVLAPRATAPDLSIQTKLVNIANLVRLLDGDCAGPQSVLDETQAIVNELRVELDKLSQPAFTLGIGATTFGSKHPGYVMTTRNEPHDEIRRAKENIRRVKGALLTTRTFPTC